MNAYEKEHLQGAIDSLSVLVTDVVGADDGDPDAIILWDAINLLQEYVDGL